MEFLFEAAVELAPYYSGMTICYRCALTSKCKKLRSTAPTYFIIDNPKDLEHLLCALTPKSKKLRNALSRHRHLLPQTPGQSIKRALTSKCKKLRNAPPRHHHRLPLDHAVFVSTPRSV